MCIRMKDDRNISCQSISLISHFKCVQSPNKTSQTDLSSQAPPPAIAMCLKHLKASRVCQDDFSAICVLHSVSFIICSSQSIHWPKSCFWQESKASFKCITPFDSCKNNGSNGSIFSSSSEVSNSSTQNVRQIETTRNRKDEANKALQGLASTAENSHSNLTFNCCTWVKYT